MILAQGRRLALRPLVLSDVGDEYLAWMNDREVTQYLESRFQPTTMDSLRAFVAGIVGDSSHVMMAIVEREQRRHIGNIKIGPIDRHHDVAEVGLLIGNKGCWGRGYATEAIVLATQYAFGDLQLRRLTAGAYASNIASIRAFERAGFRREGCGRQHYRSGGQFVDRVFLGVIRGEAAAPMSAGEASAE